jgi:hypothetical protein
MHIDVNISGWQIWVLAWIANIVAGACAGSGKQAAFLGGVLAAFMGPLGVVAALGLDRRRHCPVCTGRVDGHDDERPLCQHCRSPLLWDPVSDRPFPDRSDQFREKNEPPAKPEQPDN